MPQPRPLPEELLEEVLLRLPPHEPANLIRVALVCRRWCRLVSDPGFRRRFREFHRRPPILGMLCNRDDTSAVRFVPTAAFCSPEADRGHWRALDARHGRVLLRGNGSDGLVVWNPITNEEQMLPISPQLSALTLASTAAILCADAAAGAAGACDHLDCHSQPFVLVFAGSVFKGPDAGRTFICTYESKTGDAALSKLDVVCSAEGVGIIFLRADDVVYTIDIKTYEVKEVYKGKIKNIVPYMSFYTPACTGGDGPSLGGSSA